MLGDRTRIQVKYRIESTKAFLNLEIGDFKLKNRVYKVAIP